MECLVSGYFSKSTVKPIDKVFDFEEYKSLLSTLIDSGEWFYLAGIRRVGKTTLVRSLINAKKVKAVYINLWNLSEDNPLEDFLKRLYSSLIKMSGLGRIISIKEVSLFGVKVVVDKEAREATLEDVIENIPYKRIYIIIDEVQEIEVHRRNFSRLISWLYDTFSNKVSVLILGSIASVKSMLESDETEPLYGRLLREVIMNPMSREKAIEFLRVGFEECGVPIRESEILAAIDSIGTITGWLVEFGREYVIDYAASGGSVKLEKILDLVFGSAKKIVFGEIARALRGKKRVDIYLKLLRLIASNPYISLSELSRVVKRKKPTVLQYLDFLKSRVLVVSEEGRYIIPDPLVRRAVLDPNFEREVKVRL